MEQHEVVIVGAGPAGLSAALLLGRSRRDTLVIDDGAPRNAASRALHGFLSRDGIDPSELIRLGRDELARYPSVRLLDGRVMDARKTNNGFELRLDPGDAVRCRMLLLATGVTDAVPDLPGIQKYYGSGVHHCPYCDGWEYRDGEIGVYGADAVGLALELTQWSEQVTLFTGDDSPLPARACSRLSEAGVEVVAGRIAELQGDGGRLQAVTLQDGRRISCDALFFKTTPSQSSDLAARLGCEFSSDGLVKTGRFEITRIPGLFVAGDASRNVHLAIVAAAEGAQAAFAINTALMKEDLARETRATRKQTTRRRSQEKST